MIDTAQRRDVGAHSHPSKTRWNTSSGNKKSIVNQREIGSDTQSLQTALKNALRQAPDVILIGEIRDRETMSRPSLCAVGPLVPGYLARQQQLPGAQPHSELLPC